MMYLQNKVESEIDEYQGAYSTLDDLFRRSKRIKSSKEFLELLAFVRKFRNYSPYNNLLVYLQNPQASYYATAKLWYHKFNRTVKEDARPMLILAPMTPVLLVYDIEDTEGENKPKLIEDVYRVSGEIDPTVFKKILKNCEKMEIKVVDFDFSSNQGGDLTVYKKDPNPRIRLNNKFTTTQKFATLLHELAHLFLGHLGEKPKEWRDRGYLSTDIQELEAESVSFIVCNKFNIQTRSDIYMFFYAQDDSYYSEISIDLIMKVAGKIEKMGRY